MLRPRLSGLLIVAALSLAACGPGATATPSPTAPPAAPTDAPTEMAPTTAPTDTATSGPTDSATGAAGPATVELADSDLGQILVDAEGMTLYGFVPDEEAGESTCYDDCAEAWPPLIVEVEVEAGEGLSADLFSTVERTDGGMQLKAGDWPLYYFAGDEAPGDTNGQGQNDVWFVVDAAGELVQEDAGSASQTAPGDDEDPY
jgi:predicted lipoprotein with Yx(FWY)xxD motif